MTQTMTGKSGVFPQLQSWIFLAYMNVKIVFFYIWVYITVYTKIDDPNNDW